MTNWTPEMNERRVFERRTHLTVILLLAHLRRFWSNHTGEAAELLCLPGKCWVPTLALQLLRHPLHTNLAPQHLKKRLQVLRIGEQRWKTRPTFFCECSRTQHVSCRLQFPSLSDQTGAVQQLAHHMKLLTSPIDARPERMPGKTSCQTPYPPFGPPRCQKMRV